jgi:hypothetical protein
MGNWWEDDRAADEAVKAARETRAKLFGEGVKQTPSDRSSREGIKRSLELADLDEFIASTELTSANSELLEVLRTPRAYTSADVERFRVHREMKLWAFENAHTRAAAVRDELASLDAAELTKANVDLAREAARAARMTAWATVVLAVATVALIAATIVAALIASSGGS